MHSLIAPSAAFRWTPCPGSVLLEQCFPDEKTEASTAGDVAHEVAAELVRTCSRNGTNPADHRDHFGDHDDETFEAAAMYAADVVAVVRRTGTFVVHVEEPVRAPRIHPESYGTPDAWLYDKAERVLYIWDFKFGRGRVEAVENWQLANYAAGILDELDIDEQGVNVKIAIVQPRNYEPGGPIRRWSTSVAALGPMFVNLRESAAAALGPEPKTTTGPHCRYCKGRHDCEAARAAALVEFEHIGEPLPQGMTLDQLGRELELLNRAAEAVALRKTGVEAHLEAAIRGGEQVGGWRLVEGRGSTVWTVSPDELAAMAAPYGATVITTKALTPNQATKAGLPKDVVATITERKTGAMKLAPEDLKDARRLFGEQKTKEEQ